MSESKYSKRQLELQEVVSTKGAAKFLGVSDRTIQNYRKAGLLTPQAFGKDFSALYTKGQLVGVVKCLLEGGEMLRQKQPKTAVFYETLVKRYSGKENVQVYPTKRRLVPNFKLCKVIINLSEEQYGRMVVDGKSRKILEKKKYKRYGEVVTVYKISLADGYDNTDPLTEFDYAVLSVCISNFAEGNVHITPAIIYRGLTGKSNTARMQLDQCAAILNSLRKLMGTIIEIDETETNAAFHYGENRNPITCSSILPAYFVERTINGQDATVIYFDRESPLLTIARDRKQLLSYDVTLLDVPGQKNTTMNIMLKNHVMRRIMEIEAHRQLAPTLTFPDIFEKCRIANAHLEIKRRAREVIVTFLEHLQSKGVIKSFKVTKNGNAFHAINIVF
jgi:hypothetical protein